VRGPAAFDELVEGRNLPLGLEALLELALRVSGADGGLERFEPERDDLFADLLRLGEARVEKAGGDERFDGVGEHVRALAQSGRAGATSES
jgi:hypothetical protein